MSSKLLCACGKEHGTEEPLVITITACPNKKHNHHLHKPSAPSSSKKSYAFVDCPATRVPDDQSQRRTDRATGNESAEPSNHILICEDEGITIPSRTAEKPLIDNSTFCDLDNEADKSSHGTVAKGTNKEQPQRETNEKSQNGTNKEQSQRGTSTPYPEKEKGKGPSSGNREANDTFFDPSHLFESEDLNTSSRVVEPADSEKSLSTDISSTIRWESDGKDDKRSPRPSPMDNTRIPSSDMQLKLPILLPRYHGPGCAMEVDVMEKHDQNCRYRKKKNPDRNPIDDRSGSYDVIGRLMFKTCNPGPAIDNQNMYKTNQIQDRHHATVATIYSLLNISHKFNKGLILNTNEDEQKLQKYLARKKILEDLAKSSKSFPNESKRHMEENRKINDIKNAGNTGRGKNVTSYEVEVLYFYKNKCNKSVQFSQTPSSRIGLKKWLYHIFPCVLVEDSQTLLINEFSGTN